MIKLGSNSLRKVRIAIFLTFAIVMVIICFLPVNVFALADDYKTNEFNVKITTDKNHVFHVEEVIAVDFNKSAHHGIVRYIPYSKKAYYIDNINVYDDEYSVEDESGSSSGPTVKYIKIGDPDTTIIGKHTYKISYDLVGYLDDNKEKDFLAIDLLPSGWNTPIAKSKITFTMPKKFNWDRIKIYEGAAGFSNPKLHDFKSKIDKKNNSITFEGKNISKNYGVTLNSDLPEGYWENPKSRAIYRYLFYLLILVIPVLTGVLWFKFGRDKKIVTTVEFNPPEGLTPAEVGYLADGKVDNKDLSSMIMYFAYKGYLRIEEYDNKKFKLIKNVAELENEKLFASNIFNSLFSESDEVDLKKLPKGFGEKLLESKDNLISAYSGDDKKITTYASDFAGIFAFILLIITILIGPPLLELELGTESSFTDMIIQMIFTAAKCVLGVLIVKRTLDKKLNRDKSVTMLISILGIVLFGYGCLSLFDHCKSVTGSNIFGLLMVISITLAGFFTVFMSSRSDYSTEILGKILGFKNFIETAEEDRLKVLSEQNPYYFFNVMPYAYVFGMELKWAKKFNNIKIETPHWYNSYDGRDNLDMLYIGALYGAVDSSIGKTYGLAVASDKLDFGGEGYSGNDSSGGGFGGGGGGAW